MRLPGTTLLLACWLAACTQESSTLQLIQKSGGVATLISESRFIVDEHRTTKKEMWTASKKLPPLIASLQPQFVQVLEQDSVPMVDIQMSGGFKHRGLLVVAGTAGENFIPKKGQNWRIEKIANAVFEYQE